MINHLSKKNIFNSSLSVLLLDSGVGGLSIYDKVQCLLPNVHYIYVFDNAAFPYGNKHKTFIIKRILAIIFAIQKYYTLSLAIIACNTASIVSLAILRKKFHFPIVGVVPAIKPAAFLTENRIVGLLATSGTIKRLYANKLIKRFANRCRVIMLGTAKMVEITEEKLRGKTVSINQLRHILRPWLYMSSPPDTIVLGCTHFSLLRNELLQIFPKRTKFIDSSITTAQYTAWLLKHTLPSTTSFHSNVALCTLANKTAEELLPVLKYYGFQKLEELVL